MPKDDMNAPRFAEHSGLKILVLSFDRKVMYVFLKEGQWFMQYTEAPVTLRDRFLSLFGYPLVREDVLRGVEDAMIGAAIRSIDKIDDPDCEHCEHSVKIKGKDSAKCAICSPK